MDKLALAGCVILNEEGNVLLIHRNTPKRVQWETPGGKIEVGEKPIKTAEREVEEELGIDVTIIKKLGEEDFGEDGYLLSYVWYLAVIKSGTPKIMEEKYDDLQYFSWNKLKSTKSQLSPNVVNLVNAYFSQKISLDK
ncbi:MAG: NUDIX hydrolase [Candidatus Shapirobacteria bacterium]